MSTIGTYKLTPQLIGDIGYSDDFLSNENPESPAVFLLVDLVQGSNEISVPLNSVAVIISPPQLNEVAFSLKIIDGDTGWPLSLTNPSLISAREMTSFVIESDDELIGLRIIFI